MVLRDSGLLVIAVMAIGVCRGAPASAQRPEPEGAMSDDVRRVHERLTALTRGEGSPSELRIEFAELSGIAHKSFEVAAGVIVSQEWSSPGSPGVRRQGSVPDSRMVDLVEQLIAKRYWTFQGSRFVPDAPTFLFRFYYGDLPPLDFRCDMDELESSPPRREIRNLFLAFASEIEMEPAPPQP